MSCNIESEAHVQFFRPSFECVISCGAMLSFKVVMQVCGAKFRCKFVLQSFGAKFWYTVMVKCSNSMV